MGFLHSDTAASPPRLDRRYVGTSGPVLAAYKNNHILDFFIGIRTGPSYIATAAVAIGALVPLVFGDKRELCRNPYISRLNKGILMRNRGQG